MFERRVAGRRSAEVIQFQGTYGGASGSIRRSLAGLSLQETRSLEIVEVGDVVDLGGADLIDTDLIVQLAAPAKFPNELSGIVGLSIRQDPGFVVEGDQFGCDLALSGNHVTISSDRRQCRSAFRPL